jgi:hypothetical protein
LDDYINYSDGNYNHIDFDNRVVGPNGLIGLAGILLNTPTNPVLLSEGDYIKVNLDVMRDYSSSHNFSPYSCPLHIIGREKRDAAGNVNIVAITGEICQEIVNHRIDHAERVE